MAYTLNDIEFLATHQEDIARTSASLELTKASTLSDMETLRAHFGEHSRAVAELVTARRAGQRTHKFRGVSIKAEHPEESGRWLVDTDSVQQATAAPVANYRASMLQAAGVTLVHDVTCSVGFEGAAITRKGIEYLGSDIDVARLSMARRNVPRAFFIRADALTQTSTAEVILADPARRAGGRRIAAPEDLLPPLPDLMDTHHGKQMVIKCALGLDYSSWEGGVMVTSLDGGVKEACLFSPEILNRRRAVILTAQGEVDVLDEYDGERAELPEAGELSTFIIDPDGAVVRAGLVKDYAAREGLWQIDDRIAYLTGPQIPAGQSGFEFIEEVPIKKLKAALASHDCGSLEILVRGVDMDPDQLRKKLKLRGSRSMAVVITRIGKRGVALICGARQWG